MSAELYAALAAAQAEMRAPAKDRTVTVRTREAGNYRFSYATLDAVYAATRPALAKHGLSVLTYIADGAMVVRIAHRSGEWVDCPCPMPELPHRPQEAGSLLTYYRRYAYCMALGVVADEDDDGNAASGNTIQESRTRAPEPPSDDEIMASALIQWAAEQDRFLRTADLEAIEAWKADKKHRKAFAQLREQDSSIAEALLKRLESRQQELTARLPR